MDVKLLSGQQATGEGSPPDPWYWEFGNGHGTSFAPVVRPGDCWSAGGPLANQGRARHPGRRLRQCHCKAAAELRDRVADSDHTVDRHGRADLDAHRTGSARADRSRKFRPRNFLHAANLSAAHTRTFAPAG